MSGGLAFQVRDSDIYMRCDLLILSKAAIQESVTSPIALSHRANGSDKPFWGTFLSVSVLAVYAGLASENRQYSRNRYWNGRSSEICFVSNVSLTLRFGLMHLL